MAGEIQLNSTTFATESGGTVTVSNVDSATNRQNLGLEIGVDVQAFDADTTKNDVANTFTANQIISVTDNTNAALRVTQLGTGNALVVEDETNPDSSPFVVDASGNVGIGTSSPNGKLSVSDGTVVGEINPYSASSGCYIGTRTNHSILFQVNASEKMRIDTSGNIIIGNNGTFSETAVNVKIGNQGQIFASSNNADAGIFYRPTSSGGAGVILTRSDVGGTHAVVGAGYANGTFGAVSDATKKKNITDARNYLDDIKRIRVVKYNWITDEEDSPKEIGWIAQEVEEIFPRMVDTREDTKLLKKEVFLPMLMKCVQEQQAIIESQQSQIDALTARIEALETA